MAANSSRCSRCGKAFTRMGAVNNIRMVVTLFCAGSLGLCGTGITADKNSHPFLKFCSYCGTAYNIEDCDQDGPGGPAL